MCVYDTVMRQRKEQMHRIRVSLTHHRYKPKHTQKWKKMIHADKSPPKAEQDVYNNNRRTDMAKERCVSVCVCACPLLCRRGLLEKGRGLIHNMAARCMAAYITASISAKLQCNFLTPYFSPYPITQTTPHGYF